MNCQCGKLIEKELENIANFCIPCFTNHIEKKVKKTIREAGIQKNQKVLLINDKTVKGVVSEFLFKLIIKDLPLKLEIKEAFDEQNLNNYDKIILQNNLDDCSEDILLTILNAKQTGKSNKIICTIENLSEKEILAYAKIKHLNYEKELTKSRILTIFDKIEQKYPGSKLSFTKAIKELRPL